MPGAGIRTWVMTARSCLIASTRSCRVTPDSRCLWRMGIPCGQSDEGNRSWVGLRGYPGTPSELCPWYARCLRVTPMPYAVIQDLGEYIPRVEQEGAEGR